MLSRNCIWLWVFRANLKPTRQVWTIDGSDVWTVGAFADVCGFVDYVVAGFKLFCNVGRMVQIIFPIAWHHRCPVKENWLAVFDKQWWLWVESSWWMWFISVEFAFACRMFEGTYTIEGLWDWCNRLRNRFGVKKTWVDVEDRNWRSWWCC